MRTSRRLARVLSVVAVISMISAMSLTTAAAGSDRTKVPEAEHIILFIGDGMHLEHEIAASRYLTGHDLKLSFHNLPYKGVVATWDTTTYNGYAGVIGEPGFDPAAIQPWVGYAASLGGAEPYPMETAIDDEYFLVYPPTWSKPMATDSASAATAMSTGYKTDDGNIAWLPGDPADGDLETIAETLRAEKGYAIGVVSTVPISHATPASYASHNVYRNNYSAIAWEMLTEVEPEVVIGAGHPGWGGSYVPVTLYEQMRDDTTDDYVFVERVSGVDGGVSILEGAETAVAEGMKLFGLFGGSGGNFESPVPADQPGSPTIARGAIEDPLLKDAALAALEVVSQDEDGFFLMIEQGDIDWANHGNDYARMIGTTWDLHMAVDAVKDFVNRPGDDINWSNTLLVVTADHANSYMRLTSDPELGKGDLPLQVPPEGATTCGVYGSPLCVYPDGDVTYSTGQHTNELVRLYARGAAAGIFRAFEGDWYPCTDIVDNTQIYLGLMLAAGLQATSPYAVMPGACTP